MFKKITGVPEDKEAARQDAMDARQRFDIYQAHLEEKKQELLRLKEKYKRAAKAASAKQNES